MSSDNAVDKEHPMPQYPLKGIRVVDFGLVWAGPGLTMLLADMGAEIIKVESRRHIDMLRLFAPYAEGRSVSEDASATFHALNRNKLGIALDLGHEDARQLVMRLVSMSDVVTENFSPRAMRGWGLSYEELRKVKPDIIMISLSAAGQTGPLRNTMTYGPSLGGLAGIEALVGYYNEGSHGTQMAYCDPVAGAFGAFAVLAALRCRARTGKGQYIDLAQMQAVATMLGYPLMEYIMNKRNLPCLGNRHRWAAPHGCYRCRGDDSWISIAVTSEEEWQGLCRAMGDPEWTRDERFKDTHARKLNEDELDRHVEEWTSGLEHYDAMFRLQRAGVAGVATLNSLEIMSDPHMVSRGDWVQTKYTPTGDDELIPGVHWKLSRSVGGYYRHAPLLGGDRDYVLGELLGLGQNKIAALEEKGAIY